MIQILIHIPKLYGRFLTIIKCINGNCNPIETSNITIMRNNLFVLALGNFFLSLLSSNTDSNTSAENVFELWYDCGSESPLDTMELGDATECLLQTLDKIENTSFTYIYPLDVYNNKNLLQVLIQDLFQGKIKVCNNIKLQKQLESFYVI